MTDRSGFLKYACDGIDRVQQLLFVLREACLLGLDKQAAATDLRQPVVVVFLDDCVIRLLEPSTNFPFGFCLEHPRRKSQFFGAASSEERDHWVQEVSSVISEKKVEALVIQLPESLALPSTSSSATVSPRVELSANETDSDGAPEDPSGPMSGILNIRFENPEDLRKRAVDKTELVMMLKEIRQECSRLQDDPSSAALEQSVEELKSHKQLLVREVKSLRQQLSLHEKAMEQLKTELNAVTSRQRDDQEKLESRLKQLLRLMDGFERADIDRRSEKYGSRTRRRDEPRRRFSREDTTSDNIEEKRPAAEPPLMQNGERQLTFGMQDEREVATKSTEALMDLTKEAQRSMKQLVAQHSGTGAARDPYETLLIELTELFIANCILRSELNNKYLALYKLTEQLPVAAVT